MLDLPIRGQWPCVHDCTICTVSKQPMLAYMYLVWQIRNCCRVPRQTRKIWSVFAFCHNKTNILDGKNKHRFVEKGTIGKCSCQQKTEVVPSSAGNIGTGTRCIHYHLPMVGTVPITHKHIQRDQTSAQDSSANQECLVRQRIVIYIIRRFTYL